MEDKKTVDVLHLSHRNQDKGLALFPIGERYNRELMYLRKGDLIRFQSGEIFEVESVALMGLNTAIAEQMSRYIYGRPISRIKSQWSYNVVIEGRPRDSISQDQCLQIYYKPIVHI